MVLERGDIAFFYRPRVHAADATEVPPGVQRFFFVLIPSGGPARRLRIGRGRMPSASGQRFWVLVERVGPLARVLGDLLEEERYPTRTRGERVQPAARPVAQGTYQILRHEDHLHLAYEVEHAESPEELPEEVRVPAAASQVILFERIPRGRATWTTAGDPARLDEEGAEIVLVAFAGDKEGIHLHAHHP